MTTRMVFNPNGGSLSKIIAAKKGNWSPLKKFQLACMAEGGI
jgi:hypothetical protein